MNADLVIVLVLLAAAVVMFVTNRPRMDAVALIVVALLPLSGVITFGEAVAGFADPNIILIGLLFVLGEGLVRTGVARRMGDWLAASAGGSATRVTVLLMIAAAGLGAVMSSTAVVAIFIPIVLRICLSTGTTPRALMMPLSVAALISGMLTLVATTPNLVVNAELVRQGWEGFGFFAFTPFGLPILLLAIPYMLLARRLLTGPTAAAAAGPAPPARPSLQDWIARYELPEREMRARILPNSPLAGQPLRTLGLRRQGVNILAIERAERFGTDLRRPHGEEVLQAGDVLMLDIQAGEAEAATLPERLGLDRLPLGEGGRYFTSRAQRIGMVEVMIPSESRLIGRTALDLREREADGFTAIGLRRGGQVLSDRLPNEKLRVGDTLLVFCFWQDIERLRAYTADVVPIGLPAEFDEVLPAPGLAIQATLSLAVAVGLMVSGLLPNAHAALIGCLLLGIFRCMDMESAYRSISWKTLLLILGMMPFSVALQRTGGVDLAAEAVLSVAGEASPRVARALIFVITAGLGLFISNTATAILMAPVALAVAADLGASPYPFAMTVALAASTAFMTPISSPVNTLVVTPGGYGFGDFVKVGVPFSIICLVVTVALVPVLLPP